MAHTNKSNKNKINKISGFALPTVLIASIVMIAVLMVAVVSTSAVRVSLNSQYYGQLNKTASEAGLVYAKACLDKYNGDVNWSTELPLMPNTDCSGEPIIGANDFIVSINSGKTRSTFKINLPVVSGNMNNIAVNATTELFRTSGGGSGDVWRSYNQVARLNSAYQPERIVVSGLSHSCTINRDKAYCWGKNDFGQLGNGSTTQSITPVAVDISGVLNGKIIKSISAGKNHTCAIDSNNKAYCWGDNSSSQLGKGLDAQPYRTSPVAVDTSGVLIGKSVKLISAGGTHTCAIAVTASGDRAYCWGSNIVGQLGNSSVPGNSNVPVAVQGYLENKSVKSISTGNANTCAIVVATNGDRAYCWGDNIWGQIGDGSTDIRRSPEAVIGALSTLDVKSISVGSIHTCAINSIDKAYCWGANWSGQLGNGLDAQPYRTSPVAVDTDGVLNGVAISSISAGINNNTCAIDISGKAYCWGSNSSGQLGSLPINLTPNRFPLAVDTNGVLIDKQNVSISVGGDFSCTVDSDAKVYCWGKNDFGQLGLSPSGTIQSALPVYVPITNVTDATF